MICMEESFTWREKERREVTGHIKNTFNAFLLMSNLISMGGVVTLVGDEVSQFVIKMMLKGDESLHDSCQSEFEFNKFQ